MNEISKLTFTRALTDSGLRHWHLRGPAGLIRFETHDVIKTAAVYLHGVVAPGGADLEPCDLCGRCWPDAMSPDHAQALREDWAAAAGHDAVIRTQLERWYTENLAVWAAEQAPEDQDPMSRAVGYDGSLDRPALRPLPAKDEVVPAKDLTLVLALYAPGLPYVALARLAAQLDEAGYEIVRKAGAR